MHTLTLEVQENILEKFRSFLATLPSNSISVVEDIDEGMLAKRREEVTDIIKRVDGGIEQLHDFDSVIKEIKNTTKA